MKFSLILKIFIRVYFFILETTISLVAKWSKSKQKKNRRFITSTFNSSISFFSFGRQTCMIKTHFFFKFNVIIKRRIKDTTYTIQSLFFPPPVIILQRGGKGKKKNIPLANLYISNGVRIFNDCRGVFYQIERHYYTLASFVGRMTKNSGNEFVEFVHRCFLMSILSTDSGSFDKHVSLDLAKRRD